MDRTAMKQLEAWKTSQNRKPLIIRGARQTGKTWLSEEFGRTRYEAVARIDLMNNERARSFFDGDLDVSRILRNISLETGVPITTDTLVLLDDYDGDFSKHAPLRILERIRIVWASLPSQLAKENRKFVSLRVAVGHFDLHKAVRTSLAGYRDDDWLLNVPLWAIGRLAALPL